MLIKVQIIQFVKLIEPQWKNIKVLSEQEIMTDRLEVTPFMDVSSLAMYTAALTTMLGWSMWSLTAQTMEIEVLDLFGHWEEDRHLSGQREWTA